MRSGMAYGPLAHRSTGALVANRFWPAQWARAPILVAAAHTILNPSDDATAVSLHIYRGAMTSCAVFRPNGDGWYARDQRQLSLDRTH